ncbi:MAG: fatty acid desaturase [Solirubrobacteraceae bacterium]
MHPPMRRPTPPHPARRSPPFWLEALAPYGRPDARRGTLDILTSVLPYLVLCGLMYLLLAVSYFAVLAVGLLAAGFLLRTFIVFHDCAHGSLLPSRRANRWLGVLLGLVVYTPFHSWRHEHATHHASAGDLDRRGLGDVETGTVEEYRERPWRSRLAYRLFRNPLLMFVLVGPLWALVLEPRLVRGGLRARIRRSHLLTDVALALIVGTLIWLAGWRAFLLIQVPTVLLAGGAGIWLFYVTHQFEEVYWARSPQWTYLDAALQGSSHLRLPQPLRFFSGNVGLHHVHHLSTRIPNYNLQRAHDENPFLQRAQSLSLWDGLRAVRLKLYDERECRLVTFAQARRTTALRLDSAIADGSPRSSRDLRQ